MSKYETENPVLDRLLDKLGPDRLNEIFMEPSGEPVPNFADVVEPLVVEVTSPERRGSLMRRLDATEKETP